MANSKSDYQRQEYVSRINRVIDYIEQNIDSTMTLDKLSEVANFSKYHFHRIFSSIMGETLNGFIKRIRAQKAASMLISNPKLSITEIALDCGYQSSAVFSRAFREYFNISPSDFRNRKFNENSNIRQMNSNFLQTISKGSEEWQVSSNYFSGVNFDQQTKRSIAMKVEIREIPETTVAYIRHIGPYAGDGKLFEMLFGKLFTWAGPRGLLRFPETKTYSVYHDDPEITEEDKLRVSVCISVPENTKVDGEIGLMKIGGGRFAIAYFELSVDEYGYAWNKLMGEWLPSSGYQCDDKLCFEEYLNDPNSHPEKKHLVNICIPVKPL